MYLMMTIEFNFTPAITQRESEYGTIWSDFFW